MDKDKQRLLQKLYEALDMCKEQDLAHEYSLISDAASCIEDEIKEEEEESEEIEMMSSDETQAIFFPEEEENTKQLGFDPDIHL